MILNRLYTRYFQKSKSFLYPLLGFKRNIPFPPRQCYIAWRNFYVAQDCKLMVSFDLHLDTPEWKKFLENEIYTHEMFSEHIASVEHFTMNDGSPAKRMVDVIVFDLNFYREDFLNVIKGRYSKLSSKTKNAIRSFYGYHTPEWAHMESFLYPEKYYDQYAKILDVDIELLKKGVELCEMPAIDKETFTGERDDNLENLPGNFVDLNNHFE